MAPSLALLLAAAGANVPAALAAGECTKHTLDFIVLKGDPLMIEIEGDIVADLAKVGVTVNTRFLPKLEFNAAMAAGDFHLCFTESGGPPYDPQSFATGWFRPDNEAHYPAMQKMEPPMTIQQMEGMVTEVLSVESPLERQEKWNEILREMHRQAISNPMWSRRVPAILNKRLMGYSHGFQQFDYPMHNLIVDTGSQVVKVAPGSNAGLFREIGTMEPHAYTPNEFFIQNWIYEGLVHYGANGDIVPALATSWTVGRDGGKQKYRFTLRQNVKFHDGEDFNCAAVKMNFDHVLQPPLNHNWYHGWYHLPLHTESWRCDGEVFEVVLDGPYYPFLQELSLIRPIRILSPNSFAEGPGTNPVTHNSCPVKWGHINGDGEMVGVGVPADTTVNCVSVQSYHGTGPWKYNRASRRADNSISEVSFLRNDDWWGEHGGVQELLVINYNTSDAVKQALLAGDLDMVVGNKVLTPEQVRDFQMQHTDTHRTTFGPRLYNQIMVMNAAKAPTDDIEVRKLVMHAIDKARIVQTDMYGQATVADSLFPKDAPYCDIDLTPRWDYDIQKARLLNCPEVVVSDKDAKDDKDDGDAGDDGDNLPLILGLTLGIGIPALVGVGVAAFCFGKRKGYNNLLEEQNRAKKSGSPEVIGSPQA